MISISYIGFSKLLRSVGHSACDRTPQYYLQPVAPFLKGYVSKVVSTGILNSERIAFLGQ